MLAINLANSAWFGRSNTLHLTFEMMRFLPPPQCAPEWRA
jgi:hypothetical protein